jgi:hypothetical protein
MQDVILDAAVAVVSVLGIPSLLLSNPMRPRPTEFTMMSLDVFASGTSLPSLLSQMTKLPLVLLCPDDVKRMKFEKLLPRKV